MKPIIEVMNLKKYFKTSRGTVHAVDDVTFSIEQGKTMGLVGESGCGKSTLGRTIIHLQKATDGKIMFEGQDTTDLNKAKLRKLREFMQIIFQDPYASLNPRMSVYDTIAEPLVISGRFKGSELDQEVTRVMDLVGIEKRLQNSYPHEMDGGRRQRVGIGRAIALKPKFVVCDEPVSALDVSIQAQVLNLLMDLQEEYKLTYLFVTHDLSVVEHISDHISVMYLGQMVETCTTEELFSNPIHPYTQVLLSAIPSVDIHHPTKRIIAKGEITSPIDPKPGCRFASRCMYTCDKCNKPQQLVEIAQGHFVSCCRAEELIKNKIENNN